MIEPAALLAWSALALAVSLTPGPDTFLVASHGARGGFRAGLAAVAGIQMGAICYAALFGFGLLRVLAAAPLLFAAVKVAGAIYLAWLGVQMIWRAFTNDGGKQGAPSPLAGEGRVGGEGANLSELGPSTPTSISSPQGGGGLRMFAPFRQAFFTNILNPKVALFYLAALPQFASGPDAPAIGALLIGIHAMFGATWLSFIAFAASRARAMVWDKTFVRWLEGAIGVFFVAVAGRLALTQR